MISTTTLPTMNLSAVDEQANTQTVEYQTTTNISYTTFSISENHGIGSLLINITVSSLVGSSESRFAMCNLVCQLPGTPLETIAQGSYAGVLYYAPGTNTMGPYDQNFDTISKITPSSLG